MNSTKAQGFVRLWAGAILCILAVNSSVRPDHPFVRGDVDQSGGLNITDAVRTLRFLFRGEALGGNCEDAADADDDGELRITDAVFVLSFLFRVGGTPPFPFPLCGVDLTDDALGCDDFDPCNPVFTFHGELFAGDGVFFAIDRSGSMQNNGELALAKEEVIKTLEGLPDGARFGVIFFDLGVFSFPSTNEPAEATAESLAAATEWTGRFPGGAGGCAEEGLLAAMEFVDRSTAARNVIFYVGDGRGNGCMGEDEVEHIARTIEVVTRRNAGRAQINAAGILVDDTMGKGFLRDLAAANGGRHLVITR